jgi:hypothetical protein
VSPGEEDERDELEKAEQAGAQERDVGREEHVHRVSPQQQVHEEDGQENKKEQYPENGASAQYPRVVISDSTKVMHVHIV